MTPFEQHGIRHLSASSLNLFAAEPALWVMEKLLGQRAPVGCAAHRGSAIEYGVNLGLMQPDKPVKECQEAAEQEYTRLTALTADPNRAKEGEAVAPAVALAIAELRQYGAPDPIPAGTHQHKVERNLPGVSAPLIGYLDWKFSTHGIIVDLKTSLKLTSEIGDAHARQGAMYAAGTNFEMRFCYVTPKKLAVYRLEDANEHLNALTQIALRLQKFLSVSNDKQELAAIVCPNFESFYWSSPTARAAGRQVYGF